MKHWLEGRKSKFPRQRVIYVFIILFGAVSALVLGISTNSNASVTDSAIGISVGQRHSCAITSSDTVKCWGSNWAGQLGNGSLIQSNFPVNVLGLQNVISISAGDHHTCALTITGAVKCWGYNSQGQLGDGTTENKSTPVDVIGLSSGVREISSGAEHTCAITNIGSIKCWGWNLHGQLGDGTNTQRTTPVDVFGLSSNTTAITSGTYHSCAIVDGSTKCWGRNNTGQLGDGTYNQSSIPVDVTGLITNTLAIAGGGGWEVGHTCGVLASGAANCWGENSSGQLGNGTNSQSNIPVIVTGLVTNTFSINTGSAHTCALLDTGYVMCWGKNDEGQLGDSTNIQRTTPVNIAGDLRQYAQISTGDYHTCGIDMNGGVFCWGDNYYGQVGDGTTTDRFEPSSVLGFGENLFNIVFLPLVVYPATATPIPSQTPTSTPQPSSTPNPTPTLIPTPRPKLQDGYYQADLPNYGMIWFTVSNNGTNASDAGFMFQRLPWCSWSIYDFGGTSTTIENGSFGFVEVDLQERALIASLGCHSESSTQAYCSANKPNYVNSNCSSTSGIATKR